MTSSNATFDFVSDDKFRASLEADYRELILAMKAEAWKAVQVLAGSIIEAILIDYLIFSEYQKLSTGHLLRMDLGQAIEACRQEEAISKKTEQLMHAVRSYRNLIHPGISVRLGETANESSAIIAKALIEIIIDDISEKRRQTYGYTAQQIIKKLENDSSVIPILDDLLRNTHQIEIERLLLTIIPQRYFELMILNNREEILSSLSTGFRIAFDASSKDTKKKVVKNFIKILKEETLGSKVRAYELAFFKGRDLEYFDVEEALLVKKHLLSLFAKNMTNALLVTMEGIGRFLAHEDIGFFIDALIRVIVYQSAEVQPLDARNFLEAEYEKMETSIQSDVRDKLNEWFINFSNTGEDEYAEIVDGLRTYFNIFLPDFPDDPFLPDFPDDAS